MKIRTDFVTNSSSSSFIIAFKDFGKYEIPAEVIKANPNLEFYNELAEKVLGDKITNLEEYREYLSERYGYKRKDYKTDEEYYKELKGCYGYNDILEYINLGYTVFLREVSHQDDDDEMTDLLYSLESEDEEEVIVEEWGY